jgi:cytochrome o ubiquinol oxidase subunit 1
MPRNDAFGIIAGGLAFVGGFALVWHLWWLVALVLAALLGLLALRGSDDVLQIVTVPPRGALR